MDFVVKVLKHKPLNLNQRYVEHLELCPLAENTLYIEKLDHLDYLENHSDTSSQWLCGDVIKHENWDPNSGKGIYYRICWDNEQRELNIFSDIHCLLPIYYIEDESAIVVSSSVDYLFRKIKELVPNQEFFHQMVMFNAPIGATCFYEGVNRVKYGHHISLDQDGIHLICDRRFYEFYSTTPLSYRKALPLVVDSFINETHPYYEKPVYITLTGGFDGRTATAVAHYYKNSFITYSHGKAENDDVYIPLMLSQKLGFIHNVIDIGKDYIENNHLHFVRENLTHSGGMNGFLYPHVSYGAAIIEDKNRPIVTGFVGSELLRNAHCAGALTSQTELEVVAGYHEKAVERFLQSSDLQNIRARLSADTLHSLVCNLKQYFDDLPSDLNLNQKLACFDFEEIIPKFFGTWIYSGMHHARIRVPFMDNAFFQAIVKTEVSQFYRRFMEQNPLKRFWGQFLYSKIIQKTWPEIGREVSGKGYAPNDLLTLSGRLKVARGYLNKEKLKKTVTYDNLGLISGLKRFIDKHPEYRGETNWNESTLESLHKNERLRDTILLTMSHDYYQNITKEAHR